MEFFRNLLSSNGFMPHGNCYMWRPGIVGLHVVSDTLIALAYFSIPFTLIYFVRKRRDLPFNWIFACFGTFIFACGATHAMEVWTLWHANYWLSGAVKVITALTSIPTAVLLIQLVPQALSLPGPETLRLEIAERTRAQEALGEARKGLELRVHERTAELQNTNKELLAEVAQRKLAQKELRRSEEELQNLAARLITVQEDERKRIARDLHDDLSQRLALHCVELDLLRQNLPAGSVIARKLKRMQCDAIELTRDVRDISHGLHHRQMTLGLQRGATSFCREFSTQYRIAVDLSCEGDLGKLPESVSIGLFRFLQEALSNVAKHSGSDRVTVLITAEGNQVLLRVADRGLGFVAESVQSNGGLGLISMRERLRLEGGTMKVTSFPGQGTTIEAIVPIRIPERAASDAA
jgi:signal transduction histidine kinase